MRVAFVIHALPCGGAEQVVSKMANYWSNKGWEISILTFDDGSQWPFFPLDNRVQHIPLKLICVSSHRFSAYKENIKRWFGLRRAIRQIKPDVVISFIDRTNIFTIAATRGIKIPIIVSERSVPTHSKIGKLWERLRRILYPFADCIVIQSAFIRNYFSPRIVQRIVVIPNFISSPGTIENESSLFLEKPFIFTLGRLSEEKRHDLLLQAFSKINEKYPAWKLIIAGDGPLRETLEILRKDLNLAGKVTFLGVIKNKYEYLQQADLFVHTSSFEGFPNAICEAMSCGLPVISTDCPFGPREIIHDGVDGILVENEDVEALSNAMDRLMGDEQERNRLGNNARQVIDRFSIDIIMNQWEALIHKLVKE